MMINSFSYPDICFLCKKIHLLIQVGSNELPTFMLYV